MLFRSNPTVVILDDWHWADHASREFLDGLLNELHEIPLLVLILTRRQPGPTCSARANFSVISLDTLGPEQANSLLEFVIGASDIADSLSDRIYERTGGNALFTEELARSLMELRDGIITLPMSIAIQEPASAAAFKRGAPQDLALLSSAVRRVLPTALAELDRVAAEARQEAARYCPYTKVLNALVERTRGLAGQ